MEEEVKTLKKLLKEANAKCKDLEMKNLRLSKEIEVLRKEKGYTSNPNEMSEDMLKSEMIKHMIAYQKFPAERRRVEEEKRQEALKTLTPMFKKAMILEKEEGKIPEAIKAHEACIQFGQEHKEVLMSGDYEKSILRIVILYRKDNQLNKEIAFINKILKTRKTHQKSLYSSDLYYDLECRLQKVEKMLERKK
ncbi:MULTISPECIES: hypothetical protein [unclassified Parabacteroides]|uniref:hypothetical protein n=1 Tax=unclassified Parabacteroides TaxID=2649774 RepID=UPI002476ED52|nr:MULTISPECIES: hypothetical protein [unclassified Parabacteroides]MDH6394621.1 hypothetical protein [Parabacteroides sp. PFB2-22]